MDPPKNVNTDGKNSSTYKESFSTAATNLGHALVNSGFSMVYGGGSRGLMGVVADAALEGGSSVTGIITEKLHDVEVGHENLNTLEIVY